MNILQRLSRVRLLKERVQNVEYRLLHPIEPSVSAGYLNWEPLLSCDMLETFRAVPRLEFWDIGAAFGVFSLLAAGSRPDARVTSLEPYGPRNICCRLNTLGAPQIKLLKAYLGNRVAPPGQHTLASLEALRGAAPTVMKMDIEGGEFEALMPSLDWLRAKRPILFLEFHEGIMKRSGKNPAALLEAIKSVGYQVTQVDHHASSLVDNYVLKCI
jgi:hypothetical protein